MTPESFGTLPDGREVLRLTLSAGNLTVRLLNLGALIQDVRLSGVPFPLVLGSPDLAAYLGPMAYFGAVVGPVANRIAGASLPLDGTEHPLVANENGRTTLHGGPLGTHGHPWRITTATPDRATFELDLPHGAEGFPGNRHLTAAYTLIPPGTLQLVLTATTDRPTALNLANHAYWCLGEAGLTGHLIQIDADSYTPTDADLLPTGERTPVEGTDHDFRQPAPIGPQGPRLDTNFCLADARRDRAFAARLTGPTGVTLTLETTEPGLQVYDATRLDTAPHKGLTGAPYGRFAGVALEPQCWPDAPHHPTFPPVRLAEGETYRQETRWTLSRN